MVIPLFNREELVAETLESVLAQRTPPKEIIVVDDGSSDGSAHVAKRYPVTLIQLPENRGLSAARNAGIDAATGEVVAFVDSDDRWLPEHLTVISDLFGSHPSAGVAYCRTRSFGTATGEWRLTIPERTARYCYWDLVESLIVPITASAVRTRHIREYGGFDATFRICEDYEFFLR